MIGKFENEETLLKSYTDLEKEFTKKCQELSLIKKELEEAKAEKETVVEMETEIADAKSGENEENEAVVVADDNEESVVAISKVNVVAEDSLDESLTTESVALEVEEVSLEDKKMEFGVELRAKANEFLRNNEEARPYAKEISKILLLDRSLLSCSDPFGVAYALVLKKSGVKKGESQISKPEVVSKLEETPSAENKNPFKVEVLGRNVNGFMPSRMVPKYSSIEDARSELLRRFS